MESKLKQYGTRSEMIVRTRSVLSPQADQNEGRQSLLLDVLPLIPAIAWEINEAFVLDAHMSIIGRSFARCVVANFCDLETTRVILCLYHHHRSPLLRQDAAVSVVPVPPFCCPHAHKTSIKESRLTSLYHHNYEPTVLIQQSCPILGHH